MLPECVGMPEQEVKPPSLSTIILGDLPEDPDDFTVVVSVDSNDDFLAHFIGPLREKVELLLATTSLAFQSNDAPNSASMMKRANAVRRSYSIAETVRVQTDSAAIRPFFGRMLLCLCGRGRFLSITIRVVRVN
jgi:hypothetical protein